MLGEADAEAVMVAQNEPPELSVRLNSASRRCSRPRRARPRRSRAARGDRHRRAVRRVGERRAGARASIWPQSRGGDAARPPARARAGDARARPVRRAGREGRPAGGAHGRSGRAGLRRAPRRARPGPARDARPVRRVVRPGRRRRRARVRRTATFDRILLDPPCSGLGVLAGPPGCPLAWGRGVGRQDGGGPAADAGPRARRCSRPAAASSTRCARSGATRARACSPAGARRCRIATARTGSTWPRSTRGARASRPGGRQRPIDYSGADAGMAHHRRGRAVDPVGRLRPRPRAGGRGAGRRRPGHPHRRHGRPFRPGDHVRPEDGGRHRRASSTTAAASPTCT